MKDYLFKLTEIEVIMKRFYEGNNKEYVENPISYAEYQNLLEYNNNFIDISEFYKKHSVDYVGNRVSIGNTIKNGNVAVVKHSRYGYPIWHNHDYIEIVYIYNGKCKHYIENEVFEMKKGDLCILAPNTKHVIVAVEDEDIIINIMISKEIFNSDFLGILKEKQIITEFFKSIIYNKSVSPYLILNTGDDSCIQDKVREIYVESIEKRYNNNLCIALLTRLVLVHLIRNHEKNAILSNLTYQEEKDNIRAILDYIYINYNQVTLHSISENFNYNEAYLSRIVKKYTGKTFSTIVTELQMEHAKDLLKDTNMNLTAISQQIGCFDVSHLNKKYKKIYGESPSVYRKRINL